MCSIDIEDINKQHKKIFSKDIWDKLLNDFQSNYNLFETKKDVILFQKNMQKI